MHNKAFCKLTLTVNLSHSPSTLFSASFLSVYRATGKLVFSQCTSSDSKRSSIRRRGDRYFILTKKWKERARERVSSVGFATRVRVEARSIVSSVKHTSPVRLDFPIHLPLSLSLSLFLFLFLCLSRDCSQVRFPFCLLPLRLRIVCRRHRVRQSRISAHGTFAFVHTIRALFSPLSPLESTERRGLSKGEDNLSRVT